MSKNTDGFDRRFIGNLKVCTDALEYVTLEGGLHMLSSLYKEIKDSEVHHYTTLENTNITAHDTIDICLAFKSINDSMKLIEELLLIELEQNDPIYLAYDIDAVSNLTPALKSNGFKSYVLIQYMVCDEKEVIEIFEKHNCTLVRPSLVKDERSIEHWNVSRM